MSDMLTVEEWMFDFFSKIINFIHVKRKNRNEALVLEIKAYIDSHYEENVSLTSLSQAMSISTGYLSSMFRMYISQNFSDYLTHVRIQIGTVFCFRKY